MTFNGTGDLTVSGPEQIKVPAGTFKAMKVHLVVIIDAQGQQLTLPNDYWFAPNVGLIKQSALIAGIAVEGGLKSYTLK